MADPVHVDLVRDVLRRATDVGEARSRAALQEEVGLGAGDLQGVLDVLFLAGEASEEAPDEIVAAPQGEPVPAREPAAAAPEPGPPRPAEPQPRGPVSAFQAGSYREEYARESTVTMPRAMVDALEAPALGSLLKAGIEAAEEGVPFVFEVTP